MAKISVYDKLETNFTHNGLVLPNTIVCTVEEELNGKYVLELVHPIDEKGKWQHLIEENIIKADGQLFRIHSTESNLNYVYVYARHIFYDLLHNFLEDVRPTNINGSGALNWILSNTQYPHNFIGMSDIDTLNTQYYIRKNPVEAMLGTDSLVTRWNGEIVRDNYTIKLLSSRGQNKGAQIAYKKNMLGLEVKRDMDTVITRIMPIGRDGLLLPEKYVDSPLIGNYIFPHIRKVEFDVGVDENTTEEQAFEKLRQGANNLYEINKVDIPYVNINANLLLLENTEEYKHLKNLVKVNLGDIVSCTDNPLKITFEAKVIRIKKDVLSNKNVEVELGQFKKGISNTIQSAINEVSDELKKNTSDLEKAIERATELLTNALGGYVVKRPGELLIMDTENVETATEVWRWNLNGLGYSDTGINGPYRLAITMDGQIVADFITTGTLNAGIVKTGILASKDTKTWINLDDGGFNFKDELKWDSATGKLILGPNSQISWNSVTDQPNITQITKDTITTSYINALDITAKEVKSDWVYAGTLTAEQIVASGVKVGTGGIELDSTATISWSNVTSKPTDLVTDSKLTTELGKDYIITGKIKANQIDVSLGKITTAQIESLIVGTNVSMGSNATISWSNVTNQPTILTGTDVTTITNNTISTTTVLAQNLKVNSANIEGTITADTVKSTWIYTGRITASQINAAYGKITTAQIENLIVGTNVTMGSNASISWNNVTNQPNIPKGTYIDANGIYTGNISATQITTGSMSADRISGGTISGVTINVSTNVNVGKNISMETGGNYINFNAGGSYNGSSGGYIHYSTSNHMTLKSSGDMTLTPGGSFTLNPYGNVTITTSANRTIALNGYDIGIGINSTSTYVSIRGTCYLPSKTGFFGATSPASKKAVATVSSTTTDIPIIRNKLNELITALKSYNFV